MGGTSSKPDVILSSTPNRKPYHTNLRKVTTHEPPNNENEEEEETSQVFQCTRHATSCNNIDMGKMISKDGEPALSAYGIAEAIRLTATSEHFIPPVTPEGTPIPIAVSALIRTWETTVLLYGYHLSENDPEKQTLYLRICPWLRESSGWSWLTDRGNEPKPLKHSLNKFKKFLNKLSKTYKNKIKKIYIEIPPKDTVMNDVPIDSDNWQQIEIEFRNREYRIAPSCNIEDTVYNKYGYQNEKGDIMEFMKWYTEIFDYSPTTVHIVAHSHIMQKFAKKNLGIDLDMQNKLVTSMNPLIQGNITHQNCWSITMPYHATYDVKTIHNIIKSIKNGFSKPKGEALKEAQELERSKGAESLCGTSGSVIPLPCPYTIGGQTRRKRRYIRKTRRRHH